MNYRPDWNHPPANKADVEALAARVAALEAAQTRPESRVAAETAPSATTVPANGTGDYSIAAVWREVAVALYPFAALTSGSQHACAAYNHARNGRYAEAMAVLAE